MGAVGGQVCRWCEDTNGWLPWGEFGVFDLLELLLTRFRVRSVGLGDEQRRILCPVERVRYLSHIQPLPVVAILAVHCGWSKVLRIKWHDNHSLVGNLAPRHGSRRVDAGRGHPTRGTLGLYHIIGRHVTPES